MLFYLFNIRLKSLEVTKITRHCSEFTQLHQQPLGAVFRPTFIWKLCYKLPSVVTFTFIDFVQTFDKKFDSLSFLLNGAIDRQCDA